MSVFTIEERTELAATVDQLVTEIAPPTRVHAVAESSEPMDAKLWEQLASIGALGTLVPAEHGGLGGSLDDVAPVIERLGAHLSIVPFISSAVLATTVLKAAPDSALARQWLPALASGEARAAVAINDSAVTWRALPSGGHHLSGDLGLLLDAEGSDLVLFASQDVAGASAWFGLPTADLTGMRPVLLHDPTRRAAHVSVSGECDEASVHLAGPNAARVSDYLSDVAGCALAADSVGSAQEALDLTVAYAKTRSQFGHPIGTFQAVKHRCTDMFIDVVAARAALTEALSVIDEADSEGERTLLASVAKNQATSRHLRVAGNAMQLHGGIGFTWEHDVHLHLKRAAANQALYGGEVDHARTIWRLATSTRRNGEAS